MVAGGLTEKVKKDKVRQFNVHDLKRHTGEILGRTESICSKAFAAAVLFRITNQKHPK